jgi:signal transduction histidine kinase/ActR/RegA family two-component response regulator/PAS domain-containing protein
MVFFCACSRVRERNCEQENAKKGHQGTEKETGRQMDKTRIDVDLMEYHRALINKPQIDKTDVQRLLDAYREKFNVDLVFTAELMIDSRITELTYVSCSEPYQKCVEQKYYEDALSEDREIKFDEDGLCYDCFSYDKDGEKSILHYGIFHNEEYIGSVGILNFHEKREWNREEKIAVERLGRVLKSGMYLNRNAKVHAEDKVMIKQQNHALEAFFATTECGILLHTLDGKKLLSANKAALQILDYSSKEELEANFQMIAPSVVEADRERVKKTMRKLKKAGDVGTVGYQVRHKNGEVLDIMCRVKLLEENGQLIYQRVCMDCTEQRLQEKKLILEKENHWNEIVSALSLDYSSAFYLDIDTKIGRPYRMTKKIEEVLSGIIAPEMPYEKTRDLYVNACVHPEEKEEFRKVFSLETMQRELQDKVCYYNTYRVVEENTEKYYQAKVVRVGSWKKQHGVMVGFRNVDQSVRKDMEQKRLMAEALKQAEQASQAKTSFLSNMSHDIRTPMNAIIGYTTLAQYHFEEKERVRDYLEKIATSSNHLLSLINDVLDMSRIESGKVSLENTACNLKQVMEDINTVMIGQIQDKHFHFRMDTAEIQNEDVLCDELRLNQVLLNMLGNAVKYTPDGGEITVSLRQKQECGKTGYAAYQFCVRDNGIGMSEDFQEHLFEQFSREKNSTVSGIPGTGLGMAITKRIVDMMGGSILVQSRLGEGTEFVINLEFPVAEIPVSAPEAQEKPQEERKTPEIKKLLLAEDNPLNQEIAAEILADYGFEVEIANNGSEAVRMVQNAKPGYYHAVLMDIQMPVMNGYEAARKIRKLDSKSASGIPIIAMTANAFDEDRKNALAAGMNGFVTKPIDVEKLLEALKEHCA